MLCIMCGKTFTHGFACTNCGFNYSNAATIASLFELDVTILNETITNKTQSIDYDTFLDRIRLERADAVRRHQIHLLQQASSNISSSTPKTSGYTRNRPIAFGVPGHVNHGNAIDNYSDVKTKGDTITNETKSLDYDTLLDIMRMERAGVVDRQRMQFQQTGSDVPLKTPPESECKESIVVFGLPNHVDHDNITSNYAEALSDINNAIRIEPNNPYWYFLRAEINHSLGRTHHVRNDLLRAIKLSPYLIGYYLSQIESMDKLSATDITIIERAGKYYQKRYYDTFSDKTIVCKGCGHNFTLTVELQIYFAEHGTEEPQLCDDCLSPRRKAIRFAYPDRY